ncbi:uncharacterized protein BJ171DRAFT_474715 [Polychytrium aggregatum]|uniref:uncharacterized protein n=1 Tax=Polychytrium aggregatum TaxID=110093 RepID=UPI0022FDB11B|nr:uncharacterized protein BJ171DRAFT_474715 [Polychytrium aggregatum]KAI9204884.1 hypothetical protein BJ171DRAFT_474715 [Polychytrium aggregatum]
MSSPELPTACFSESHVGERARHVRVDLGLIPRLLGSQAASPADPIEGHQPPLRKRQPPQATPTSFAICGDAAASASATHRLTPATGRLTGLGLVQAGFARDHNSDHSGTACCTIRNLYSALVPCKRLSAGRAIVAQAALAWKVTQAQPDSPPGRCHRRATQRRWGRWLLLVRSCLALPGPCWARHAHWTARDGATGLANNAIGSERHPSWEGSDGCAEARSRHPRLVAEAAWPADTAHQGGSTGDTPPGWAAQRAWAVGRTAHPSGQQGHPRDKPPRF